MGYIKNTIKRTPFYKLVKHFRYRKMIRQWTKHDQEMLDFYSQFASRGELVFDVGANIGNRTKIFLKQGLKVVAIEPQDECVNILKSHFGKNANLTIIQKVLGSSVGEAELMISNANTISSLSKDWIEAVKSSGRFSNYSWEGSKIVQMTTLDQLIALYGVPIFIKIDVEGFEHEVVSGLSRPVNHISLEYTPEFIDSTFKCISHLESLGEVLFNYSIGENMQLELENYVTAEEIKDILNGYKHDNRVFGDVYCKFIKG